MGGRKPVEDEATSRHTVNGVLMDTDRWARLKEWCYEHDMRIGTFAGKAIAHEMDRRKI